jgi:site-specific recombinase XerD
VAGFHAPITGWFCAPTDSLRVRRAREKAGIATDAKLYGTRHAFGTRAITKGVDIKTLAELMGHTTTKMTEHYINLAKERSHLVAAARKVTGSRRPPTQSKQK